MGIAGFVEVLCLEEGILFEEREPWLIVCGQWGRSAVVWDGKALEESLYLEVVSDEGFKEHGGAAFEAAQGMELVEA